MTKRMLIDATHPEETRVAVVDGTRLEEFDFEMAARRQIKSNIYLAKVTRVEPSLQAAFVEYGGNRHGFLPFPEIHPDYYRIPVGDRQHTSEPRRAHYHEEHHDQEEASHLEDADGLAAPEIEAIADIFSPEPETEAADDAAVFAPEAEEIGEPDQPAIAETEVAPEAEETSEPDQPTIAETEVAPEEDESAPEEPAEPTAGGTIAAAAESDPIISEAVSEVEGFAADVEAAEGEAADHDTAEEQDVPGDTPIDAHGGGEAIEAAGEASERGNGEEAAAAEARQAVDVVGGDEVEDAQRRRRAQMPHYKIQEVIKRRQIMLIQVSKEERGNKGAAVTTYLSLPGRYCVLMPNTARGGGVSRKIANPADRKRMKELISDLEVPDGMSVILRTAGVERTKAEIKRDLEYLLRLWENIRTLTLESTAPALIYEEGNLVKRAIRDLYARDIESIEIAGEEAYRQAKDFMRMLMPSHAKRVQPYRDPTIPLFFRYQVESQIDLMHNPVAHLRSGGYIVIDQTEALVSIDVNSGRSTRERNIEETALKTNLEAADEIARQLRLRDLGGLIVIDFIDMDEPRHDGQVERRLKEAMKNDRARIQVGRISPFGLLELSRQRLHPSLIETNFHTCAHCLGTGLVRSTESASLMVLRAIEEEGIKRRSAELAVTVATDIALYILNQKRAALTEIEQRCGFSVRILADDKLMPSEHRVERVRLRPPGTELPPILSQTSIMAAAPEVEEDEEAEEAEEAPTEAATGEASAESDHRRKRRRGRRRRGRDGRHEEGRHEEGRHEEDHHGEAGPQEAQAGEWTESGDIEAPEGDDEEAEPAEAAEAAGHPAAEDEAVSEGPRRRRRGRRGGRGRSRHNGEYQDDVGPTPEEGAAGAPYEAEEPIAAEHPAEAEVADVEAAEPFAAIAEVQPAAAEPMAPEPAAPEPVFAETVAHEPIAVEPVASEPAPIPVEQPRPAARDFEIVNQPPTQPRRGFWKRLVEK